MPRPLFFCIGNNIKKHPDIFESIIEKGHAIGNHTYNHLKGWKTKTKDYLKNTEKTQKLFENQNLELGTRNLFRPPYGKIKPKQSRKLIELGYEIIMWDVLSFDWDKSVTPETCFNNVVSNTNSGSIVVFHDSVKASRNMQFVLPRILEYFSEKGYQFKAISL